MSDYYQFRDETGTPIDYYQLVNDNNELCKEIERLNNIINEIEEHFVFLKMNSTGGNKEFFEDILVFIEALKELTLKELKGSDKE